MKSVANKGSEVYRHKLGLLNRYIRAWTATETNRDKDDVRSKAELEPELINVMNAPESVYHPDIEEDQIDNENEFFPQIRERSPTLTSKHSVSMYSQKRQKNFVSKQHQAYSILQLRDLKNYPSDRNKLAQSRIEGYQQMSFTSVDDIDEEIVQKGARSLIRNYSQQIYKYKQTNDIIPKRVNATRSKLVM